MRSPYPIVFRADLAIAATIGADIGCQSAHADCLSPQDKIRRVYNVVAIVISQYAGRGWRHRVQLECADINSRSTSAVPVDESGKRKSALIEFWYGAHTGHRVRVARVNR